jgi:putative Ca2+/H+ antiporter (TMEM165/GDT1 family)
VNLAISAAVFPVIFLGELPDKTMIASLSLATRGRARSVWLGAAAAFGVHVIIATTAGVLAFRLLPHRMVGLVAALIFLGGAVLAGREAIRGRPGAGKAPAEAAAEATTGRRWRPVVTAFVVIFLAEWGDLTQLLTANLAARYHSALSVGIGSLLALWAVAALAVLGGKGLLRLVNMTVLRAGMAVLLAGLACWSAWAAFA